jgi:acetyl-CoA C-acetyltransferase
VIAALVSRAGLGPDDVDDILLGQCYPNGEAPAIGRVAALDAGLSIDTPGLQIDRRCGSGLQAILYAVMQVQAGVSSLVIAGGAESMSQVEHYSNSVRYGNGNGALILHDRLVRARETAGGEQYPVPGGMVETAENLRREYRIPRQEQDELAYHSHQRAVAAQDEGRFDEEIVPVTIRDKKGKETIVTVDEHPRRETNMEILGALRPVMIKADAEATVTAGNASGQNDAAAACIVTTPERAADLGLRPLARILSWAVAGVPPRTMGIGPVPSTAKALEHANLTMGDMDLIELNEAFAAQVRLVRGSGSSSPRTSSASTSMVRGYRSAIRSVRREGVSRPPCCGSSTDGRAGTRWRRCVSAGARGWPRCSSVWADGRRHPR